MGAWIRLRGPGRRWRWARCSGLLAVAELAARLSASSTVRAGLAAPVGHDGVTVPTALLMCGFCLLATVPAGLLRPVPAAVTVYLAAALSLTLFELVTIAGAAALLVAAYRLARAGSLALAVVLGVPFLGLAVLLASTGSGRTMAVAGGHVRSGRDGHRDPGARGAAGLGDPARDGGRDGAGRARAEPEPQRRPRGHRGDAGRSPGARGSGPGSPASCTTWSRTTSR